MKLPRSLRLPLIATGLAGLTLLTSCGGGGDDEAGAETPFSVTPATFNYTYGAAAPLPCGRIENAVQISVIGGAAPYRVHVANPQWVTVDQEVVPKGGSFKVTFTGTGQVCFNPATISVTDELGRSATVTLVTEVEDAETP